MTERSGTLSAAIAVVSLVKMSSAISTLTARWGWRCSTSGVIASNTPLSLMLRAHSVTGMLPGARCGAGPPPVWPTGRQAASGAAPDASAAAPSARRRVTPVLCFNMGSPPAAPVFSSRPVIRRARAVAASRGVR